MIFQSAKVVARSSSPEFLVRTSNPERSKWMKQFRTAYEVLSSRYFEKDGCKYVYLSCSMGKQAYILAAEDVDDGQSYLHAWMPDLFPDISTVKAI